MKPWLFFLLFPAFFSHDADCFGPLFEKGKTAFEQKNYGTAIVKWRGAMQCPDCGPPRQALLLQWIDLAKERKRNPNKINEPLRRDFVEKFESLPNPVDTGEANRIEQFGEVNWSEQYVEAEGVSILNHTQFPNEAQAMAMATRGAEVVAYANLLEITKGVRVQRTTTVRDLMTTSDVVRTEVEGIVRGARRIGEPEVADGAVRVRMRMPLYQLAPLTRQPDTLPARPDPLDPRPEPIGWLLPAAPGDSLALLLRFADGHFDPVLSLSLVDSEGRRLFDFSVLIAAGLPVPAAAWTGPTLLTEAMQNADGTVRILSATDQDRVLGYLNRRAGSGKKATPAVAFLPLP